MPSLKKRVGKLIPYPLIAAGRRIIHYGPKTCEVCGASTRARLDSGYGFPVLEQLQVVGGLKRRRDLCPICHSGSRERLIWFYLTRIHLAGLTKSKLTIAHFAPEKGLSKRLQGMFPQGYTAYDIAPHRYRHLEVVKEQNLEKLTLPDQSADLLLCNHVMEHVYDLKAALQNVHRVLADDGITIMQVPLALNLDKTIDGGQNADAAERIARYGQDDHVRLFTPEGYRETLEAAGFSVEAYLPFADDAALATQWELDPFETLYIIRRAT
ncbi:MAG: class I SAM-dependent methyltransferase [Sphingobium sp.]